MAKLQELNLLPAIITISNDGSHFLTLKPLPRLNLSLKGPNPKSCHPTTKGFLTTPSLIVVVTTTLFSISRYFIFLTHFSTFSFDLWPKVSSFWFGFIDLGSDLSLSLSISLFLYLLLSSHCRISLNSPVAIALVVLVIAMAVVMVFFDCFYGFCLWL